GRSDDPHRRTEEGVSFLAPRTLRGLRRITVAVVSTAAAVTVSALLAPTPAHADPSTTQLAQQVEEQGNALSMIVQQYNTVNVQLGRTKAQEDDLAAQLPQLSAQVDRAAAAVNSLATHAYEGSTMSSFDALLSAGSPGDLIDRMDTLTMLARGQQRDISALRAARDRLVARKAELDTLLAQQPAQQNDAA